MEEGLEQFYKHVISQGWFGLAATSCSGKILLRMPATFPHSTSHSTSQTFFLTTTLPSACNFYLHQPWLLAFVYSGTRFLFIRHTPYDDTQSQIQTRVFDLPGMKLQLARQSERDCLNVSHCNCQSQQYLLTRPLDCLQHAEEELYHTCHCDRQAFTLGR